MKWDAPLNIMVKCKGEIERFCYHEDYVLISISSPGDDPTQLLDDPHRREALFLEFHDIESQKDCTASMLDSWGIRPKEFSKGQAQTVSKFVNEWMHEVDVFVCQCEAGISRSAGCAAAISKHVNKNDAFFFKNYHPNTLVRKRLLRALKGYDKET